MELMENPSATGILLFICSRQNINHSTLSEELTQYIKLVPLMTAVGKKAAFSKIYLLLEINIYTFNCLSTLFSWKTILVQTS